MKKYLRSKNAVLAGRQHAQARAYRSFLRQTKHANRMAIVMNNLVISFSRIDWDAVFLPMIKAAKNMLESYPLTNQEPG